MAFALVPADAEAAVGQAPSSDSVGPSSQAGPAERAAQTQQTSRLEARNLQKFYGSRKVVKDVSLTVNKGEIVGLLGPNGAGENHLFLHDRGPGAFQRG